MPTSKCRLMAAANPAGKLRLRCFLRQHPRSCTCCTIEHCGRTPCCKRLSEAECSCESFHDALPALVACGREESSRCRTRRNVLPKGSATSKRRFGGARRHSRRRAGRACTWVRWQPSRISIRSAAALHSAGEGLVSLAANSRKSSQATAFKSMLASQELPRPVRCRPSGKAISHAASEGQSLILS